MAELMAASLTMRLLPCAQAVLFAVGDTIGQGSSRKAGSPWDWPRAFALPALDCWTRRCALATLARSHAAGAELTRRVAAVAGLARSVIYGGVIYCLP